LLNHYFESTGFSFQHPHLLGIGVGFPILEGPFMYVYILVMINKSGKFKPIYWLHALPFIFFTIYFIFDFYFLNSSEKIAYYEAQDASPDWIIIVLSMLSTFLGPIYVILSLLKLRQHEKNIANDFSYTEQIDLLWLKYVLGGLGFVWVTVLLSNVLFEIILDLPIDQEGHLIYISLTIAVFFLGFFGLKQQAIYVHNPKAVVIKSESMPNIEKKEQGQYVKSGLNTSDAEEHLKRLMEYMDNECPYLNGKLSLKEVAEFLDIAVNHLSQVINEQLGKNFFDFVNTYRVEEVKRRFADSSNEQYTLLALAYDSGFNSKSSFNSIFKKITGLTPSKYNLQIKG